MPVFDMPPSLLTGLITNIIYLCTAID